MELKLNRVEFYITNVCNYNCDNCNRLNNYQFNGHQMWDDYKDVYAAWSKRLNFDHISILGGEPTLNPSIKDWLVGVREFWPNSRIELITNGTRFEHIEWLYDVAKNNQIEITISTHNSNRFEDLVNFIKKQLIQPISEKFYLDENYWSKAYESVRDPSWPECQTFNDFFNLPDSIKKECLEIHGINPQPSYTDANNVTYQIQNDNFFVTAPLQYVGNNKFKVYNSDPEKAHDVCISKTCHHFIRGKLYKCHHVGLLPEFMDQYLVEISDDDKKLLESYRPANIQDNDSQLINFINSLPNSIPQCKLCPETLVTRQLTSSTKKPKILKKYKLKVIEVVS